MSFSDPASSKGKDNLESTTSVEQDYSTSFETQKDPRWFNSFIDSFKPYQFDKDDKIATAGMSDLEKSVYATAKQPLARRLRTVHLRWIALGGVIGSGLYVSSGYTLAVAGPAGLLISYFIVGLAIFCVMMALAELATQYTVSGSFVALFGRFIHPSFSFTLGILYSLSWLLSFPSELIACAMTIQYWDATTPGAVWVAVFYVVLVTINLFGVRAYGHAEVAMSFLKVVAIFGFVILGICIICGVGQQGYIGARYWHHPGAFNNGFKGVCSSFISAAFTFGGTELVALASAESENPRKSLPKAVRQVFWRILGFYMVTAVVIGFLVPYNDDLLLNGSGIAASPFVIAVANGGIRVVPHILNAVVLIAAASMGNSCIYGCSRTIASLAVQGQLPAIFAYVDRQGRPLVAILVTALFGALGFLVESTNEETVFTWFFSVCSLSSFFIWGTICFIHLRFRWALKAQGRTLDEVIFISPIGMIGSYLGVLILFLIIVAEVWISIWPIGESASVSTFWQNCLSLPLMIVIWFAYHCCKRSFNPLYVKLEDIDLDTGRRDHDVEVLKLELAEERAALKAKPLYYKVYRFFC